MARVLEGKEAEQALVDHTGITRKQLREKTLELGGHVERISDKNPSIMINMLTEAISSVTALIERSGEPEILDIVLKTIKDGVERIRRGNKKESN